MRTMIAVTAVTVVIHNKHTNHQPEHRHNIRVSVALKSPIAQTRSDQRQDPGDCGHDPTGVLADPPNLATGDAIPLRAHQVLPDAVHQRLDPPAAFGTPQAQSGPILELAQSFTICATCITSLSPRPLMLTMTIASLPSFRACFFT